MTAAGPIGVRLPDELGGYTVTIDTAGAIRCTTHGTLLAPTPGDAERLSAAIHDHTDRWHAARYPHSSPETAAHTGKGDPREHAYL